MASNTKPAEAKTTPAESAYPIAELIANYKLFGANREIVVMALRKSGKTEATFTEAKVIVDKFKNKEVK